MLPRYERNITPGVAYQVPHPLASYHEAGACQCSSVAHGATRGRPSGHAVDRCFFCLDAVHGSSHMPHSVALYRR